MNYLSTPIASLIFIFTIAISFYSLYINQRIIEKFALHPYSVAKGKKLTSVLLSGFLHSDLTHLLFNMISFYFFAFALESYISSINFAIIYFGSMVIANIPTIMEHKNNYRYYSLGASGAISGIIFSMILINPFMKMIIFPIPFPLPAIVFGVLYLLWSYFAAKRNEDFINHSAHFWGALSGVILTIILEPSTISTFIQSF
jgi:membrane associated rhomboid family serine protease